MLLPLRRGEPGSCRGLDAYGDKLFRGVSVPRNRLAFLQCTFDDETDGVFRHRPGFFEGIAERADFRKGGHDHLLAAGFERLEVHRVVVIGHRVTSLRKSRFAHVLFDCKAWAYGVKGEQSPLPPVLMLC